jgi:hypothetical protein
MMVLLLIKEKENQEQMAFEKKKIFERKEKKND